MKSVVMMVAEFLKRHPEFADELGEITTRFVSLETQTVDVHGLAEYAQCSWTNIAVQEEFHVVTMNTHGCFIADHIVARCGIGEVTVHGGVAFRPAIVDCAAQIVLMHNHLSHDVTPSDGDCDITRRMCALGAELSIPVVDHVIVSAHSVKYFSFRDAGFILQWDGNQNMNTWYNAGEDK